MSLDRRKVVRKLCGIDPDLGMGVDLCINSDCIELYGNNGRQLPCL